MPLLAFTFYVFYEHNEVQNEVILGIVVLHSKNHLNSYSFGKPARK